MKYADEIESLLKNNQYYVDKIEKAAQAQLLDDLKLNNVNVNVCSTRFRCLEHIMSACQTMRTYALGIQTNLDTAKSQDKYLLKPEVEIPEPEGDYITNDGLGTTVEDARKFYEQREQEQSQQQPEQRPDNTAETGSVTRGSEDSHIT